MSNADEAGLGIANTLYPPPPDYYKAYTTEILERLAELRGEPSGTNKGRGLSSDNAGDEPDGERSSMAMGSDEANELAELEGKLHKPRADWVNQDGRWMCFGQMYTVSLASWHGAYASNSSTLSSHDQCAVLPLIHPVRAIHTHRRVNRTCKLCRSSGGAANIPSAIAALLPSYLLAADRHSYKYRPDTRRTRRERVGSRGRSGELSMPRRFSETQLIGPVHSASHESLCEYDGISKSTTGRTGQLCRIDVRRHELTR